MLRVIAMVLFGLMFLAEAGDLYGLVLTIEDPVPAAERFGITAGSESCAALCSRSVASRRLSRRGLCTGRIIHPERSFSEAPWCALSDTSCLDTVSGGRRRSASRLDCCGSRRFDLHGARQPRVRDVSHCVRPVEPLVCPRVA